MVHNLQIFNWFLSKFWTRFSAEYASDPIPGVAEMMSRIIEHSKNKDMRILLQPELNKNIVWKLQFTTYS